MSPRIIKILVSVIMAACIGALGYLYYEYRVLTGQRNDLAARLEASEKKADLLQNRYKEQKALEANLLRTKLALEGRIGKLQTEAKALEEENAKLLNDHSYLAKKLEQENQTLKIKIEELTQQSQALSAELQTEKQRYAQAVKDHEARVRKMEAEAKTLDLNLKRTVSQFDRCKGHNERLSLIGEELLYRYENKGAVGTLLQKEPFTGMRKVELENLIQEYTEKIDKEKITQ